MRENAFGPAWRHWATSRPACARPSTHDEAALEPAPQLVAAWYNRGIDLMNAGRLQEALASFTRAIDLYPCDAQAHNNRGLTRLKLGDVEGARGDFGRALELEPGMREAEENLKRLLAGRSNPP